MIDTIVARLTSRASTLVVALLLCLLFTGQTVAQTGDITVTLVMSDKNRINFTIDESGDSNTTTLKAKQRRISGVDTVVEVMTKPESGTDFVLSGNMLVIPAGELTSEAVNITAIDNNVDHPDDKEVTLSGTVANTEYPAVTKLLVDTILKIADDDTASDTIDLTLDQQNTLENGGSVDIMVTASLRGIATLPTDTVITVSVTADTQTGGFVEVPDVEITIPAFAFKGTAVFEFKPVNDRESRGNRTLTVSGVTTASGINTINPTILTIIDDEPTLIPGTAVVDGSTLSMIWNRTLDESSVPPPSAFSVQVTRPGRSTVTRRVAFVSVQAMTVTLTLVDPGVAFGDTARITYTVPASGNRRIRDESGSDASGVTGLRVINNSPDNHKPLAHAGPNRTVLKGDTVTLDGSASSDPDGDKLSYSWRQRKGSLVTLSSNTVARPTFVASSGEQTFQLTVTDTRMLTSAPDRVTITVSSDETLPEDAGNDEPIANAGPDQTVEEGQTVTLDGTASSDPDDALLTWQWSYRSLRRARLSSLTTPKTFFTAPELLETRTLWFGLKVHDGSLSSSEDKVRITVLADNDPPTAIVGPDQTAREGEVVTLDGSGSYDPEQQPLTYTWTQTDGPLVTLTGSDTVTPGLTIPNVGANGVLEFSLVVNDGVNDSTPDSVNIAVTGKNDAPGINDESELKNGGVVTLMADEDELTFDLSDVFIDDGNDLSYQAEASDESLAVVQVRDNILSIAPDSDAGGEMTLTVIAEDEGGLSVSLTITVIVEPGTRSLLRGWRLRLLQDQAPPEPEQ